jgi:hypothetical protein
MNIVALVILALGLALTAPARAQGELNKSAPISVETDKQPVPTGTTIVLHGKTIAMDDKKPVRLTVTWLRSQDTQTAAAKPPPDELSAPYGPNGDYRVPYTTGREGVYRVDAHSPDGSGRASTEFTVIGVDTWSGEQADAVTGTLERSSELLEALRARVAGQPDSPARRDLQGKLDTLGQALATRQGALQGQRDALDTYAKVMRTAPQAAPAFAPMVRALKDFRRDIAPVLPQLVAATAEAKARNVPCDALVKVEEGFKLLSTAMNITHVLFKTTLAFGVDLATSVAASHAPAGCDKGCTFALTQVVKQHAWVRAGIEQARTGSLQALKFVDGLVGFVADAAALGTRVLFDRYCERFEGPLEGHMRVEYLKDGSPWWRYTVKIKGQVTLVYRNGADASQPIPMAGHLVGTGTEFTVAQPALRVLQPKMLAGAVIVGRTTPPIGFPFTDFAGALALVAVPTSFFIAVDAELVGNQLTLKLGPSRYDFNKEHTVASGRYAIGGGLAGAMLSFTTFDVGYDNARGLIEKATDAARKPIALPVAVGKDKLTATATFNGERGQGVRARGAYELKLTLCNPKC